MQNWFEVVRWIQGLGFPESFDQYKDLVRDTRTGGVHEEGSLVLSDVTVQVLTNKHNPNNRVVLRDAYPIKVNGLRFASTDPSVNYLEAEVTLTYAYFTIPEAD